MDYKVGIVYGKEGEIDVERKSNIHMDDDIPIYCIEYCVNEGFHSYSDEKCCIKKENGLFNIYTSNAKILVVSPYNSLLNKSYQYVYADCVIPKGSVYYENEGGELVSEKIKVIGYKPISDSALKLFNSDSLLNLFK